MQALLRLEVTPYTKPVLYENVHVCDFYITFLNWLKAHPGVYKDKQSAAQGFSQAFRNVLQEQDAVGLARMVKTYSSRGIHLYRLDLRSEQAIRNETRQLYV